LHTGHKLKLLDLLYWQDTAVHTIG
jgi:hypothetical protein